MDIGLQETLIREILALEEFFHSPPACVCEEYGLQQDMPLEIKFGPDIESYFVSDGQNIFASEDLRKAFGFRNWPAITELFVEPLRQKLVEASVIDENAEDGCAMDGYVVETRFTPRSPLRQCEVYQIYKEILQQHAREWEATVFPGEGHWHFSVKQNAVSCLNDTLRERTAQHIVDMQRAYPAFFVKPYIAESERKQVSFMGPVHMSSSPVSRKVNTQSEYSVRFKQLVGGGYTIEPRLALQSPHQPVFLNLYALKAALFEENAPRYRTDDGSVMVAYNAASDDDNPYTVMRGQGGYLSMLEETANNLRRGSIFADDVAVSMFEQAVNDYTAFLVSGYKAITMPASAIDQILITAQHLVSDLKNTTKTTQKSPLPSLRI